MKTPTELPIFRRHRLITGQAAPDPTTAIVQTMASNLQTLALQASCKQTRLHIAPSRQEMQARLHKAGQLAKAMRHQPSTQEMA